MAKINKNQEKICKAYNKRLKKLHNQSFKNMDLPLDYFVTYLQFLRDMKLLNRPFKEKLEEDEMDLVSLITAINEFAAFKQCINNCYDVTNGIAKRKVEFTEETAQESYRKELAYHWETFWELVKLYMEDWSQNV